MGNKIILAHILVKTVDEFKGMNPKDVVSYIEGEPFISVVPVELGLTNAEKIPSGDGLKDGQRIVGLNTENAEINEGLIRFDIIFSSYCASLSAALTAFFISVSTAINLLLYMKDGISQVIVNVEAQKDEPTGYHILNRAVFYSKPPCFLTERTGFCGDKL